MDTINTIKKGTILWYGSCSLKSKIQCRLSPGAKGIYLGTFPIICLGILTEKGDDIGYLYKVITNKEITIPYNDTVLVEYYFLKRKRMWVIIMIIIYGIGII